MNWLVKFLGSSIGRKVIMSLTGLFLIIFLIIHLIGNLSLLTDDGGEAFNTYAYFMTHNPLIKFVSYGLYFFILLHTIQGILIVLTNYKATPNKYDVKASDNSSWASRNMIYLGLLIFAFLCLHMGDFWWKMKQGVLAKVSYDGGEQIQDLYSRVHEAFHQEWIVVVYLIGLLALGLHLNHGFQSAFQTMGLNHPKYTPFIKLLGKIYAIAIPLGFAIIPIIIYFY